MPTLELQAAPVPGSKGPGRTYRVDFPFPPYEAQRAYMGKVLQALDGKTNALLESPTGTGKTLSLLCSTLAWQQRQGSGGSDSSSGGGGGGGGGAGMQLKYEDGPSSALASAAGAGPNGGLLYPRVQGGGGVMGAAGAVMGGGCGGGGGGGGRPVVVYASRTHAQLSQVVKELKTTGYRPRSVLLGSREQLCVHPEVGKLKGGLQNRRCGILTSNHACRFKNNLDSYLVDNAGAGSEVADIEELVTLGKEKQICPYYMMRQQTPQADLVLMPYNYLLDAGSRKPYQIRWPGAVIVFDEAHNLEGIASDAWSVQLTTALTASVIKELFESFAKWKVKDSVIPVASGNRRDPPTQDDFTILQSAFLQLEAEFDAIQLTSSASSNNGWGPNKGGGSGRGGKADAAPAPMSGTFQAARLLDMLDRSGLGASRYEEVVARMERVANFRLDAAAAEAGAGGGGASLINSSILTQGMENFLKAYRMIFFWGRTDLLHKNLSAYRLHVTSGFAGMTEKQKEASRRMSAGARRSSGGGQPGGEKDDDPPRRVLNYWCFSPGLAMEQLVELQVRSILLTSGTLSPLDSFAAELRIPFPVRLENKHVINVPEQAWLGALGTGPNGQSLSSAFGRRDDQGYQLELGETLIRLARVVPHGMLVFFPSYGVMESCLRRWKRGGGNVYDRLNQVKPVMEEPKRASDLPACMLAYDSFLRDHGGACLLAVCRGKVSEGMDFADHRARAVVITGIPFPPAKDPKVELKKKYLDDLAARSAGKGKGQGQACLKGMEWYVQQAARAVNQAVGRVIRHRDDYGAVILLDERFGKQQQLQALSAWARPHTRVFEAAGAQAAQAGEEEQGHGAAGGGGYAAAAESLRGFFQGVKGIRRLNPSARARLGARAGPADAYSDGEGSGDDEDEEEEEGRRRGAVVVDPSKLAGDDGYLAPDAITRELPPASQQPASQWRPGGQGGGGVGDGSVAAGREAALHKFLEFKAAIKHQQHQERVRTAAPSTGAPPSTSLASLFAQKQQASASATAATAAAARRPLVRKGSLSEALGLTAASAAAAAAAPPPLSQPPAAAAAPAASSSSSSSSSSSLLSRCLSQAAGAGRSSNSSSQSTAKPNSSSGGGGGGGLLGRKRVGLMGAISSSSSSSLSQPRPRPLAIGGGRDKKAAGPPPSSQPSPRASAGEVGKAALEGKENKEADKGQEEMMSLGEEEDDDGEEEEEWQEDAAPASRATVAADGGEQEEEEEDGDGGVDMEEMDGWCQEAKAALGPERFARFQQHLKAALKGQVQTMKEFQAWAHPALSSFLATPGADPPFLHRLAVTALPPFLVPIFDGMVKTRFRPKNAHSIVKSSGAGAPAPAPAAGIAGMALAPVPVKQEAAASKPFVVPGSEEEVAALDGGAGGSKGKRPRPEGSSGLSATGLNPSQELLSQTTRRDREALARLQWVMMHQQRESGGGKKRARGDGAGDGESAEAAAKQQCRMCYQTAAVYVSPCGHLACLSCWKGWLGRVPSCFYKCGPVALRQLKRVVHDQKAKDTPAGSTAPSGGAAPAAGAAAEARKK